jgi:hypothetical protein
MCGTLSLLSEKALDEIAIKLPLRGSKQSMTSTPSLFTVLSIQNNCYFG